MNGQISCCENCAYWRVVLDYDEDVRHGECRRHAPVVSRTVLDEGHRGNTVWPRTIPDDWCGDHDIRPE